MGEQAEQRGVGRRWQARRRRRAAWWPCVAAAAVWAVCALGGAAQSQDAVDLERLLGQSASKEIGVVADVAFEGYVAPSQRAELRVEVSNRGPDAALVLRVEGDGVSVERQVDLARGGRKIVRMEATAPQLGGWTVSVFQGDARVAWTKPKTRRLQDGQALLAFVGERPPGMRLPNRPPGEGAPGAAPLGDAPLEPPTAEALEEQRLLEQVRVARATEAGLPESARGYAPLRALFWSNPRMDRLSAAQVDALRVWIWSGGHLIVAVDDGWRAVSSSPLGPLLPAALEGVRVLRAESDGAAMAALLSGPLSTSTPDKGAQAPLPEALPLAQGALRPTATRGHASAEGEAEPLTWTWQVGDGRVTLWRSSWERLGRTPPLKAWLHWAEVERETPRPMEGWAALRQDEPKLDINPLLMTLVLLIYVLVIGPIDYAVLKRLKRLEWTVVTYSATIALFSVLAWLALALSHDHSSSGLRLATEVWYVPEATADDDGDAPPEALRLRWVLDGFFSTSRRKLELTAADAAHAMWVHREPGAGSGLQLNGERLVGAPARLEAVVPAYALLALVQSDARFVREGAPLRVRAVPRPALASGEDASAGAAFELRNTSGAALGTCWVWDGMQRSGPHALGPGASAVASEWAPASGDVGELIQGAADYSRLVHWTRAVGLDTTRARSGGVEVFCYADVDRAADVARLDAEQRVERSVVRVVVRRASP